MYLPICRWDMSRQNPVGTFCPGHCARLTISPWSARRSKLSTGCGSAPSNPCVPRSGGLSGGQRQAIAIARAVGAESTIVLLDEPTAALGVAQTEQVLDVVKRLRETNHAVVYISHNLRDIFDVSDRITVLRHGGNVAVYDTRNTNPDEIVVAMTRGLDGGKSNGGSHGK